MFERLLQSRLQRVRQSIDTVEADFEPRCCGVAANARSIAESRSFESTGLVRKSTAPAFIARTDIGMSPCPVRKTIGNAFPVPAR